MTLDEKIAKLGVSGYVSNGSEVDWVAVVRAAELFNDRWAPGWRFYIGYDG